jgi:hypothetical protein
MNATTPATTSKQVSFPRPLTVAADMRSSWDRKAPSFDKAAEIMMAAHAADGATSDVPFGDIRQYAVVPFADAQGVQRLALGPVSRHREPTPMRRLAFTSLCSDLRVPVEYMRDRLPAPIQLAAMNYHLATYGGTQGIKGTMRLRGNELAALVGPKYAVLDHADMLQEVRAALSTTGMMDEAIVRAVATGTTDVLRISFPSLQRELKKGDVTQVCLDVSNSVFGTRALHITGGVYRLVCTNGMQSWEQTSSNRIIHTGASDKLRNGIREAVPLAVAQARGLMDAFAASVSHMVENVWEQITQLRDLTADEQLRVRDAVAVEAGVGAELDPAAAHALPQHVDLYSYVNGITRAAHQSDPARRLDIEALAGRVLRSAL